MDKEKPPTTKVLNQTIDILKANLQRAEEQHKRDQRKILELEQMVLDFEEELEMMHSHEMKLLQTVEAGASVVMEMNKNINVYREKVKKLSKLLSVCVSINQDCEDAQEAGPSTSQDE